MSFYRAVLNSLKEAFIVERKLCMRQQYRAIKKNLNSFKNSSYFRARFYFTKYYNKLAVDEKKILFQSYDGSSFTGNVFYIFKTILNDPEYNDYEKIVVAKEPAIIQQYLKEKGLYQNVTVVKAHTRAYCKALASAKYLFNNATFATYFAKKEGQIYLNTWHGTPLKNMGKKIKSAPHDLGNSQRNFLMCDYMLNPNDFTFEHMKEDYMLDNLFKNKYVVAGYPRNATFFDKKRAAEIREELELEGKQVFVYMPTWRGENLRKRKTSEQTVYVMHTLFELEKKAGENAIIYVKLHNYTSSEIDFDSFKRIRTIPECYETYEFLSIADCLITDYSSVFFDFANTGKKIILYAYDKEEYLATRGMYIDYNSLPFTFAYNSDDLIREVNNIDSFTPYNEFRDKYNNYDNEAASKNIVDLVFKNKVADSMKIIDGSVYDNGKENVLFFPGALMQNGITTAARGLINNVDKSEYNYILTFYRTRVEKNKYAINDFEGVDYIPIQGPKNLLFGEAIVHFLYYRCGMHSRFIKKVIENLYRRETKRVYPNLKFSHIIHYSGYESRVLDWFKVIDADRILYIHSNMEQEAKANRIVNPKAYKRSLLDYDKIVCIREGNKQDIIDFNKKIDPDKVYVAHNVNDIKTIIERSEQPLTFDDDTYCNITKEELENVLNNEKARKYITIGRFSPEKGHERLIKAFLEYSKDDPDAYLLIVGGHGAVFDDTLKLVEESGSDKIILVRHISNPHPILIKCDMFVLSSFYEGLPMTIMEALILNKPIISTEITGLSDFLRQGYGYLVENSQEGLLKGFYDYKDNKITGLVPFDAEAFNNDALQEFEDMLKA